MNFLCQSAMAQLFDQDPPGDPAHKASWSDWVDVFVYRWGKAPTPESAGQMVDALHRMGYNVRSLLNIHQAGRAWCEGTFTWEPHEFPLLHKFQSDVDRFSPHYEDEPMSPEQQDKLIQYEERFNPTEGQRKGRIIFDMGRKTDR